MKTLRFAEELMQSSALFWIYHGLQVERERQLQVRKHSFKTRSLKFLQLFECVHCIFTSILHSPPLACGFSEIIYKRM